MMKQQILIAFAALCIAGVIIAGCTTPTTTPPATTVSTPVTTVVTTTQAPANTIVNMAVANGNLKTLVAALQAAKLDTVLNGPGPYTIFAPSDSAFANLPNDTLQRLLITPSGQLSDILKYHVVQGDYMTSAFTNNTTLKTLEGENIHLNVTNGSVYVNGAKIVASNIKTDNGEIQVINAVLFPPTLITNTTISNAIVASNVTSYNVTNVNISTTVIPPKNDPALQGVWYLKALVTSVGINKAVTTNPSITAAFYSNGTVSGFAGCNNYNGGYSLTGLVYPAGKGITIGPLASTMMYCADTAATETAYLQMLQAANSYNVTSTQLNMTNVNGSYLVFLNTP
ncbi:MAG TPA: fasciclin domain-containing protein [Methanoregulaceae archaeon]|nr:fasciclin domain-containing protein [Methanoregulaceae archaeon]